MILNTNLYVIAPFSCAAGLFLLTNRSSSGVWYVGH